MWIYKPAQPLSADDINSIIDILSASLHVAQLYVDMDMRKVSIVMLSYTTKTKDDIYARLGELRQVFAGAPLISFDIIPHRLGQYLKDSDSGGVLCWSRPPSTKVDATDSCDR